MPGFDTAAARLRPLLILCAINRVATATRSELYLFEAAATQALMTACLAGAGTPARD